jgi:hypothetical protein
METEGASRRWYRKRRYQLLLALVVALLLVSLVPQALRGPISANQSRLNRTIDYFANNYNETMGLVPEIPGSHNFWLYSDNYLVILAVSRYDPGNQSTMSFAGALEAAFGGYIATLPVSLARNQYMALNFTVAYFDCSSNHTISWTSGGTVTPENASAIMMTTSNDLGPSCANQNYADLLLLQALYQHRENNTALALSLYRNATADFDGYGFKDLANANAPSSSFQVYQTYKVALYVYATYCLGQQTSASDLASATNIMLYLQSNSTGGFATEYTRNILAGPAPPITPTGGVNTETTALAALALEEMIKPTSSC